MAIDVSKPSSSDYPTKPTPSVSPPPHRDYQRNKNQTIPTTTTKDQNFDSTAQENGEKSALVRLLEEQAREFEEDRSRRLQKDEADHTRRLEEHAEYWAKRTEDRVQREQRADARY